MNLEKKFQFIINEEKKLPIIMKFIDEGEYTISFKANYIIIKKELVDDSFEINEQQLINFEAILLLLILVLIVIILYQRKK